LENAEDAGEAANEGESSDEEMPELVLDTRPWADHKQVGPVVLRVEVKNKTSSMQQINVALTRANPAEATNL
jgi:hypothetical protein